MAPGSDYIIRTVVFVLLSQFAALPLAGVPVEVRVVRQGWTAEATPEAVAAAMALRLPGLPVVVVDDPATGAEQAVCTVVLDEDDEGEPRLTVRCPAAAPVLELLPEGSAVELARRAAVEAAILVQALTGSRTEPSAGAARPPPAPGAPVAPPPAQVATSRPGAASPANVALRLAGGVALAPDLPGASYAVTVDARVFFGGRGHVTLGATLAGPFEKTRGGEIDSSSDRSAWVGAGYRVPFGRLCIDASLALAYTIPLLDAGGEAEGDLREEDRSSRVGLRAGATVGWVIHPSLVVVVELAARLSLVERAIVNGDREALGLGTLVLEPTAGLELRL